MRVYLFSTSKKFARFRLQPVNRPGLSERRAPEVRRHPVRGGQRPGNSWATVFRVNARPLAANDTFAAKSDSCVFLSNF